MQRTRLAERLASLDVREYTDVEGIRQTIEEIVAGYIETNPASSERRSREPFYFCASEVLVLPTPFVAHSTQQFVEDLARVSVHSIHHHFIEARLRLKLNSNDFSQWLEEKDCRKLRPSLIGLTFIRQRSKTYAGESFS